MACDDLNFVMSPTYLFKSEVIGFLLGYTYLRVLYSTIIINTVVLDNGMQRML